MSKPLSAHSSRPLCSADRCDLLVPRSRTTLSQNRAFAVVDPALWNNTPPALRSVMLQGISAASLRSLKTFLFTCLSGWKRLWIASCERRYTNNHITFYRHDLLVLLLLSALHITCLCSTRTNSSFHLSGHSARTRTTTSDENSRSERCRCSHQAQHWPVGACWKNMRTVSLCLTDWLGKSVRHPLLLSPHWVVFSVTSLFSNQNIHSSGQTVTGPTFSNSFIHSFFHSEYLYSAPSRNLLGGK